MLMSAEMKITKALAAAPELARAHYVMGWVLCATNRVERGMEELERALASDANLAVAHAAKGWAKIESGRAEEAEVHILEALRLSPRDTTAYLWFYFLGRAKAYLGQFGEAAPWLRKSIDANRNWPWGFFFLAACLAHMDRIDDARREVKAGLEVLPTLTLHRLGPRSDNPVVPRAARTRDRGNAPGWTTRAMIIPVARRDPSSRTWSAIRASWARMRPPGGDASRNFTVGTPTRH